jgi:CHAT domain-containing protein
MTEFYRGLFERGESVAGALRAAQLQLLQQRATRAPFYWAAFEVHGLSSPLREATH